MEERRKMEKSSKEARQTEWNEKKVLQRVKSMEGENKNDGEKETERQESEGDRLKDEDEKGMDTGGKERSLRRTL